MVVTIENRNFNVLGFGTLGTLAVTVLCNYSTHELSKMLHIIMPLLILLGMYYATFNNKNSAIIRGYIAGIEENIGQYLGEDIFLWNRAYHQLFHNKYFPTNSFISVLYSIAIAIGSMYSFYNLFEYALRKQLSLIFVVFYLVFFITFSSIFSYDLLTNSKTKQYARIYFHLINKKCSINKLNINKSYLNEMKKLLKL